jgi:hypothetical protein
LTITLEQGPWEVIASDDLTETFVLSYRVAAVIRYPSILILRHSDEG